MARGTRTLARKQGAGIYAQNRRNQSVIVCGSRLAGSVGTRLLSELPCKRGFDLHGGRGAARLVPSASADSLLVRSINLVMGLQSSGIVGGRVRDSHRGVLVWLLRRSAKHS